MRKTFLMTLLLFITLNAIAMPKIRVKHQRNADNFAEIKIINETVKTLVCSIAIDGYKIKFQLTAKAHSKWYKATDQRFNYKNFRVWCDYASLHPNYYSLPTNH